MATKAKIQLTETGLNKLTATIRDLGKSDTAAQKVNDALQVAKVSVADQCREMGLTSNAFVSPKNGGTLTAIQYFPKSAIAMLQADPAALAKGEKAAPYGARTTGNRRHWQMQIGSRMKDVRNLLHTSETKAQAEKAAAKEKKKPQAKKDQEQRASEDITVINALTNVLFLVKKKASGSIPNSWDEGAVSELIESAIKEVGGSMKASQRSTIGDTEITASLKKNVTDKGVKYTPKSK